MTLKFSHIGWLLAILLGTFFYISFRYGVKSQEQYQNILHIKEDLAKKVDHLKTENGNLMAQNEVLHLSNGELQILIPELEKEISNLKLKKHQAKQVTRTSFFVDTISEVVLRDSIIFDTVRVKILDYDDNYFKVDGIIEQNRSDLHLSYQDTLVQVVYYGPRRKPWLWIFSKRILMQRVSLKNPNARIHYSEVIEIER